MKVFVAITPLLVIIFAGLRFALHFDPFIVKVIGVVMAVFGAIMVFAFGTILEDLSEGTLEIGGALFISGAIIILFI
jgi:hypothetical protein